MKPTHPPKWLFAWQYEYGCLPFTCGKGKNLNVAVWLTWDIGITDAFLIKHSIFNSSATINDWSFFHILIALSFLSCFILFVEIFLFGRIRWNNCLFKQLHIYQNVPMFSSNSNHLAWCKSGKQTTGNPETSETSILPTPLPLSS